MIDRPRAGRRAAAVAIPVLLAAMLPARAADASGSLATNRSAAWAQPVVCSGVPNLHRVSTNLYRSAQPTAEGIRQLDALGVRTVVNLRSFHSDGDELAGTSLAGEHLYMKAWHPEFKEAVRFLKIATDPARTPVLVHCQHGADRTGTMCALYRVAVQGWTKEEAVAEMCRGGYGFHTVWQNLPEWIDRLDVDALRAQAGIQTGTVSRAVAPPG